MVEFTFRELQQVALEEDLFSSFIVDEGVTERSQVMKTSREACAYKIKNQVSTNKLLYVESKA